MFKKCLSEKQGSRNCIHHWVCAAYQFACMRLKPFLPVWDTRQCFAGSDIQAHSVLNFLACITVLCGFPFQWTSHLWLVQNVSIWGSTYLQNHGILPWFGMEGTLKIILFQPPAMNSTRIQIQNLTVTLKVSSLLLFSVFLSLSGHYLKHMWNINKINPYFLPFSCEPLSCLMFHLCDLQSSHPSLWIKPSTSSCLVIEEPLEVGVLPQVCCLFEVNI